MTKVLSKSYNKHLFPVLILISLVLILKLIATGSIDLIAEEAYYWNYANHLDFSYFDHPPMVAYLIKLSTLIFGTNEFAVRLPALICWLITAVYSYRLTEVIKPGAGIYSTLLLSILPFFFILSIIITPDIPLMAAWAASLYFLYKILIENNNKAWLLLGVSFGLGMLSKYTIALLVPAILIYIFSGKNEYKKLATPYPYIAAAIAIIIFTPVIYWNATHNWASFLFQSTRRFSSDYEFTFHELLGLLILFLTPVGIISLIKLFKKNYILTEISSTQAKKFLQVFTSFPLIFFAVFSLVHNTKFNWIGPGLLAIVPWIAAEMSVISKVKLRKIWSKVAIGLFVGYLGILICISTGKPEVIYRKLFPKFNDWENFYIQINSIASLATAKNNKPTIIVPLDKYNIASELSFYQRKIENNTKASQLNPIFGRNVFGQDALMYKYWYQGQNLSNSNILIIHDEQYMLQADFIQNNTLPITPIKKLWSLSQGKNKKINDFYYQIVAIKTKSGS